MSALLIIGLKNAILVIPLALIAFGVGRWSRRPALTHLLWTLVLVKLLTPPLVNVPVGWRLDIEGWFAAAPAAMAAADPGAPAKSGARRPLSSRSGISARSGSHTTVVSSRRAAQGGNRSNSTSRTSSATSTDATSVWSLLSWSTVWEARFQVVGLIWLTGSLWLLARMVLRSCQFHRYLSQAQRRHEWLGPRVGELAARVGITIAPRVIVVDSCVSPMLWGMGRRASLVFPSKLVERLSPAELDSLLLHELAHFARGDHWVRVLELAVGVLYWWHPVCRWARHELETSEEHCCDAWVVEHQQAAPHTYAEALLATIDFLHEPGRPLPPVACGLGEVPFLRTRLIQIMRGNVAARLPRAVTGVVMIGGALCAPLDPALWANATQSGLRSSGLSAESRGPTRSRTGIPTLPESAQRQIPSVSRAALSETIQTRTAALANRVTPVANPLNPQAAWATAISPNGKYRLEVRPGYRTTLVSTGSSFRLDLTAHQMLCCAFAPDSRTFFTGHSDAVVRHWDSDSGVLLKSFKGSDGPITSMQVSPDGLRLAAGDETGGVVVWNLDRGEETQRLEQTELPVSCLRWSHQGDRLAVCLGGWTTQEVAHLLVWSPAKNVVVQDQPLPQPVGAMDWLGRDEAIVLAAWDGQAVVWNLATGSFSSEVRLEKDRVSAAAWSADCSLFETADEVAALLDVK